MNAIFILPITVMSIVFFIGGVMAIMKWVDKESNTVNVRNLKVKVAMQEVVIENMHRKAQNFREIDSLLAPFVIELYEGYKDMIIKRGLL